MSMNIREVQTFMKTIARTFVATIVLSAGAWGQTEEIGWHSTYGAALEEARETGKPLLVAFRCVP